MKHYEKARPMRARLMSLKTMKSLKKARLVPDVAVAVGRRQGVSCALTGHAEWPKVPFFCSSACIGEFAGLLAAFAADYLHQITGDSLPALL
jgi:hypothetical protein